MKWAHAFKAAFILSLTPFLSRLQIYANKTLTIQYLLGMDYENSGHQLQPTIVSRGAAKNNPLFTGLVQ